MSDFNAATCVANNAKLKGSINVNGRNIAVEGESSEYSVKPKTEKYPKLVRDGLTFDNPIIYELQRGGKTVSTMYFDSTTTNYVSSIGDDQKDPKKKTDFDYNFKGCRVSPNGKHKFTAK